MIYCIYDIWLVLTLIEVLIKCKSSCSNSFFYMLCREQSVVPVQKRKKGKRKHDALQEAAESDDAASLCTLATGEEESMDNIVSTPIVNSLFSLSFLQFILSMHFIYCSSRN